MDYENIAIPYGKEQLSFKVPKKQLLFTGEMSKLPKLQDFEEALLKTLDYPIGTEPLSRMVAGRQKILVLIDDNTRITPVKKILPVLLSYLKKAGVQTANIEILIAPGTHRVMSDAEVIEKVGEEIFQTIKISQHDFLNKDNLVDLGSIMVGESIIPVILNRKILEADFIIGLGNIVPHSDAGFSAGAKIIQPGICGYATTAATHKAAALLEEIPLGFVENPCRLGMEEVARKVGLSFIINVVMNHENEIVGVFSGDFVKAHREGVELTKQAYGVRIPEKADIVVVSSFPCDIDYWQAEKGLISAYFAVKEKGYIVFAAPCSEGLEHNHPKLREWMKYPYQEACKLVREISPEDEEADLVAADLAICNARIIQKANVLVISEGISQDDVEVLGYRRFDTLQQAVDFALEMVPDGTVGVLPRGGDCLPILRG
ncbi:MAG: nickel-dependent lactate racemase [Bacillota bacterium]